MTMAKCEPLEAMRDRLENAGQSHLLRHHETLSNAGQSRLVDQVVAIDWDELASLSASHVFAEPSAPLPPDLQPPKAYPRDPAPSQEADYTRARAAGEALVRAGKVAVFTVAGGQGSRLGHDAPKGTYPTTPIRRQSIFGVIAESICKAQSKYGGLVPWYIMTSASNDAGTRAYLVEHDHFGLEPDQVMLFPQGMMPALDAATGRVLLAAKDTLALSPNGHGGAFRALVASGAVDDMRRRGVEQISYTQVDNPLACVVDPLFLGLHVSDGGQMSSKALPKTSPDEKVGVFAASGEKMMVIEYSDMPTDLAAQRDAAGALNFRLGSIAIHAIAVDLVAFLGDRGGGLPFHRAVKKVDYFDLEQGCVVRPETPNAVKLEMFVFDALPICDRSIVYETDRVEEFAPIKNADAASIGDSVDSPYTSRTLQIERAARWLESHGVTVSRGPGGCVEATIEISPLTAVEAADLTSVSLPARIESGEEVLL